MMREILERNDIIKTKQQPPNLKTLLTRARFDENHQDNNIKKMQSPQLWNLPVLKDVCASRFFFFFFFLLSAQLKERLRVLVQVTCPFTL